MCGLFWPCSGRTVLCHTAFTLPTKTTAGELITETADARVARLRMAHRRRRQPQRSRSRSRTARPASRTWKAGPPLLRIGNERINENALQYITPNGFAGSLFDLEPATTYEARFVLTDPTA
jgi:hypothetical protein